MRRVVVTGMGIISPIGNTIEEYRRNLHAGICGVGRISRYDAANSPVKLAAEVKNFIRRSIWNREKSGGPTYTRNTP